MSDRPTLDVAQNRSMKNYSYRELLARILWGIAQPAFRFSPRPFWSWRRWLLRMFGAKVGRDAHIYPTARFTMPWNVAIGEQSAVGDRAIIYALGNIRIGPRATISQHAHLCAGTHDLEDPARQLLKPPIEIGADAWICADAFVGPGVRVGEKAIVGARAVSMKDVGPGITVVGNPAKPLQRHVTDNT